MAKRTCTMPECVKPHRARGLCSTHYNVANSKPVTMDCAACGKPVIKTNQRNNARHRPTCSTTCRAMLQRGPTCPVPLSHPSRMPLTCSVPFTHPSRSTPVPYSHPSRWPLSNPSCKVFLPDCQVCGRVFATVYTVSTCSAACAEAKRRDDRREHKQRRRARKRAAFVAPVSRRAIFERDHYRCHICKRKVLMGKAAPHPRSPVIDHVIPLAAGGTHEPANARTACFLCNCIKSDRGGNEQLMLIG